MNPGQGEKLIIMDTIEDKKQSYITLGAQIGSGQASEAVSKHLIVLRRLLDEHYTGQYAEGIDEFAPVLRVDGNIGDTWYWNFEGLQRQRLSKKQKYITVDIGVPRSRWENASAIQIRTYLIDNLRLALEAFVARLKKEKIPVDDRRLFEDFKKVEEKYLTSI
jgi:hypothetical protein